MRGDTTGGLSVAGSSWHQLGMSWPLKGKRKTSSNWILNWLYSDLWNEQNCPLYCSTSSHDLWIYSTEPPGICRQQLVVVLVSKPMALSITVALKTDEGNRPCFRWSVWACFLCVSDFFSELLVILFNRFQTGALGKEVKRRGLLGHTHACRRQTQWIVCSVIEAYAQTLELPFMFMK